MQLANLAAGLEVERLGVATVSRAELSAELRSAGQIPPSKVVTVDAMMLLAEAYRKKGKRIVFTNGCFDLLHIGHVTYLQEAATLGDVLVVAVNSDRSVRRLKGDSRPVINQADRALMLAALSCVDHVIVFDDDTPHSLLHRLRPDVLVKGGTYSTQDIVGREAVQQYGGNICVTGKTNGISTTIILEKIKESGHQAPSENPESLHRQEMQ